MQKLYSEYLLRRLDSKKESGKSKGGGGCGRSGGRAGRGGRNAAMRSCSTFYLPDLASKICTVKGRPGHITQLLLTSDQEEEGSILLLNKSASSFSLAAL